MQANISLLLGMGFSSIVACALMARMLFMREELKEKIDEALTAKRKVSELQEALNKKSTAAADTRKKPSIKPSPLLWMNKGSSAEESPEDGSVRRGFSSEIPSPEYEIKYKNLYCKLDEHIQKFSSLANKCLTTLANDLRHTEVSGAIKGSLADLAVQLKRLNPLLNTDHINLTIFGLPKETAPVEEPPVVDSNAQGLRNVIIQQRSIILDLKQKMSKMSPVDSKQYEEQLNQLEKMLAESETCVKTLEKELTVTHSQLEAKQTQIERTDFLQTRVKELETHETKLAQEVIELKNECLKGTLSTEKEQEFVNKIADLRSAVIDREKQLGKFKAEASSVENEYTRLFENYQGLLKKYKVTENDDIGISKLSTEQMLELEEIKAMLKSKEFELDRSSAECKLLETSYLELLNSANALEKSKEEMDHLRIENITLGNQLEQSMSKKLSGDVVLKELNDLKQKYSELKNKWDLNQNEMERLRQKENELVRLRIEYRMMEEQFLAVATAALG